MQQGHLPGDGRGACGDPPGLACLQHGTERQAQLVDAVGLDHRAEQVRPTLAENLRQTAPGQLRQQQARIHSVFPADQHIGHFGQSPTALRRRRRVRHDQRPYGGVREHRMTRLQFQP